jgi:iron-sulfur cluster repair protein YtfE (RIC family)
MRQRGIEMSDANASIIQFFTQDHRACDAEWAALEGVLDGDDVAAARKGYEAFEASMERHFHWEEEVLFPALEAATGMAGMGPTAVMRAEHRQVRGLLAQMRGALDAGETGEVLDQGDTLLMLLQQHNAKEEAMLYPMAEMRLAAEWPALRARLK